MKKLVALALLLSLGMFTVGCEKKKEAPAEGGAPPAEAPPADKPAE
jgi:hypothetical protein